MIIKNNLGLEVSIDKEDMAYVVSKYQGKFDDIDTLDDFEKRAKKGAWNVALAGAFAGLFIYGVGKYAEGLKNEASKEVLREIHRDKRAQDVFQEMFFGGK